MNDTCQTYKNLPPFAGIGSFEDAVRQLSSIVLVDTLRP